MSTNTLRLPRWGCSVARRCKSGVSWKNLPGVQKKAGAWLGGVKGLQGEPLHAGVSEPMEQVSTAALQMEFCSLGLCRTHKLCIRMPSPRKPTLLGRSRTIPSSSAMQLWGTAGPSLPSPPAALSS